MKALISPQEAQALIRQNLPTVPSIDCPLKKCAGRILRQSIEADRPFPPFNRSMMDGYAIRAAEIAKHDRFQIIGQAPAGAPPVELGVETGNCIEIMTGAVVPADTDCVVPYEDTQKNDDGSIRLLAPGEHVSGNCIHALGSDHAAGAKLLLPGRLIGSREIAIATTCGYSSLQVSKIPAITIVSTGDELVAVDAQPQAHQIRRSNDAAVETALARVQLHAKKCVYLPDERAATKAHLEIIIEESDFVIISGGISMGKKDYIPEVLDELGLHNQFHGVRQKPGKPFGYWNNAHCGVFALPGNPLSVLVCLHRYVIPALQTALEQSALGERTVQLATETKARDNITVYLPVQTDASGNATPLPAQNSGDFVSILATDGFVELAPTPARCHAAGSAVGYIPWL